MPLVSVVVPVHNAEPFLTECLDSIAAQTLRDFEVILVDDGSTDGSRAILNSYVESDSRFRVIAGPAQGRAGLARNCGLRLVTSEFTVFWDADDVFNPTFLEKLSNRARHDNSDLVITNFETFGVDVARLERSPHTLQTDLLPVKQPFSATECGAALFSFSHGVVWATLYRTGFIRREGIEFQDTQRFNDVLFRTLALATAQRISVINESLVYHRVDNARSLQGSLNELPLEYFDTFEAIRKQLISRGIFSRLENAFAWLIVNLSIDALLRCCSNVKDYHQIYNILRGKIFPNYGIDLLSADVLLPKAKADLVKKLLTQTSDEYLFSTLSTLQNSQRAVKNLRNRAERAERKLTEVKERLARNQQALKVWKERAETANTALRETSVQ